MSEQALQTKAEFINASGLEFTDISTELWREYEFPPKEAGGDNIIVKIYAPTMLNVSKSGGHRVFSNNSTSHYIPAGWVHLSWRVKDGAPNFVK